MIWFISKSVFLPSATGMVCLTGGLLAAPVSSPIPLEKGCRWTYAGEIEMTVSKPAVVAFREQVCVTNINWTMEVIDCVQHANAEAAVVCGYPDELAWYQTGQNPAYSVLLTFSNRVFRIKAHDEKQAKFILHEAIAAPDKISARTDDIDEIFALPLAEDKRWGGDIERKDGWYCWHVEGKTSTKLQIKGYSDDRAITVYTVAYRTNPDHEILDVAPGLGITRYAYEHHGTVASANVHLVSFTQPH
jgi:hypothetical protein